jgi:competence protein ComEC
MRPLLALIFALLLTFALAELEIHFVDVGQGDAVLIRSPDGQNVLYDGGRRVTAVLTYLLSLEVESIDLVIASHPHADHIGGLAAVVGHYRPQFYMDNGIPHTTLTYANLLRTVELAESTYLEATARRIGLGEAALHIVPPPGIPAWGHNDNSVGVIVEYGEFRAGLSGDAERRQFDFWAEEGFMEPVQVYKSSHHGSPNGDNETSMEGFQPEVVVIGVGADNPFGHPSPDILELYERHGALVYRTDEHGTVVVTASPDGSYSITIERGTAPLRECIDINSASVEELRDIIHIGEERAAEILELRPFDSVEELTRISGIESVRLRDIISQGLACVE